ncbi:Uncharacterised protein [Mycobacteroides abscessus subsp. abscessus]|nr:Uncharacterised protein [Mycobacteroides abscessus subsp. abscessus]
MGGFLIVGDKIPEGIVGSRSLRHFIMRLRLDCMNKIRELNGILYKKYRQPTTVENLTNTGVFTAGSCRNFAFVYFFIDSYTWNSPCAAKPRA